MKDEFTSTEDLLTRARRGCATPVEQRRVDMLVGASKTDRWLFALGSDFDRIDTAVPGDAALLATLVSRVAEGRERPIRPARSRRVVLPVLVASLLLISVAAAAFTLGRRDARQQLLNTETCARTAPHAPRSPRVGQPSAPPQTAAAVEAQAPASVGPQPVPLEATSASRVALVAPVTTASALPQPRSPAALFREANALRKSGRVEEALRAYQALTRTHPSSSEARVTHVLLGRLYLQKGSPASAEREFRSYLEASPNGTLAEEALSGGAAAARRLGHRETERRALQTLISRFPASIYARPARQRLRELD